MALLNTTPTPTIEYTEGTTPANPPTGDQFVFIDSADHKLKRVNSSGAVVTIESAGGSGAATTDHFIVGQGGEGDTDLSAKVIIPLFNSSYPDVRVAGTNDDEFDVTDTSDPMTGWTTLGTPTAHDINSTFKSHYYLKRNAAAGVNLTGIYKAVPTLPFTVTARLSGYTSSSNYNLACLFIAEASPGKMDCLESVFLNGYYKVQAEQFSSPTGSSSAFVSASGEGVARPPIYFRIRVNSSTNVDYFISATGFIYSPLSVGRNPGFTVGSVGLAVSPTGTGNAVELAADWIRFV